MTDKNTPRPPRQPRECTIRHLPTPHYPQHRPLPVPISSLTPPRQVILVTAIAPHTLSFRPILLPDTLVLRIGVPFDARTNPYVSFDGKDRIELLPGDYVTVSASRYPFPAVLPLGAGSEDWIDGISRTLNWWVLFLSFLGGVMGWWVRWRGDGKGCEVRWMGR